jgi:hypothetical protein
MYFNEICYFWNRIKCWQLTLKLYILSLISFANYLSFTSLMSYWYRVFIFLPNLFQIHEIKQVGGFLWVLLYWDVPKVFGHCDFLLYISCKTTFFKNIIPKSTLVRFWWFFYQQNYSYIARSVTKLFISQSVTYCTVPSITGEIHKQKDQYRLISFANYLSFTSLMSYWYRVFIFLPNLLYGKFTYICNFHVINGFFFIWNFIHIQKWFWINSIPVDVLQWNLLLLKLRFPSPIKLTATI